MKQFLIFLLATSFVCSEIVPIQSLKRVEEELGSIDQNTWVVFDVDMTLIVPKEPILWWAAESVFFSIAEEINPGVRERDFSLYHGIVLRDMEWELLTAEGPALIKAAQKKGAKVIALTAMGHGPCGVIPSLAAWRQEHLLQLGFDFSKTAPHADLPNFHGGILFSGRQPKGEAFLDILNHLQMRPSKVIFVDDRLDFATSMDEVMTEAGIPVTCYHFQEIDNRPVIFTPSIVRKKLQHLFEHHEWPTNHG